MRVNKQYSAHTGTALTQSPSFQTVMKALQAVNPDLSSGLMAGTGRRLASFVVSAQVVTHVRAADRLALMVVGGSQ